MSLRVWLPLTKDLRNQGLDNVTVTNSGATFNSAGKLGGCYYFNRSTPNYLKITNPLTTATNGVSMAFWVKLPSNGSVNDQLVHIGNGSGWTNNRFTCFVRGGASTLIFSCGDGTNNTNYNCTSSALSLNQWTHVICLYENSKMKIYLDGVLDKEYSTTITPSFTNVAYIGIGAGPNVTEPATAYLNDVRIYDHALSEMEVKQLAQGLVLHYPLSDKFLEGTTNLITTEDCLSSTCYNGAISKYNYGTNTDMYKTVTTYDGRKGTKVYMGTNGNSAFPYVYVNNMYTSDGTNSPAYKTLSFDYYGTVGDYLGPYPLGSGTGTATYKITCKDIETTRSYSGYGFFPVTPNEWNHIEVTFHGTTEADAQWGYIRIGNSSHTSNTSNFWFFANMQLETKDHVTGYAGVGGTRNSTIVYDTSGFCNNGTISGALTISNDTPKYKVSTYMPAAATITHNRCLDNTEQEWSCAAWVKPTVAGNYQNLNNFNESNRLYHGTYPLLYLNSGTNDYYNYGNLALPANQWSHIVFVFKNSTGTKLIYINGENHTNTGGPNRTSTPKGIPDSVIIGGGNYEGGLCDYRKYATALSADDILSLYKNSNPT